MPYTIIMLPSRDIHIIEKFISDRDNSRMYEPTESSPTKETAFESVLGASPGSFCFYACEGFNEYAFYKSRENSIYSLTFHATRLTGYFKK